MKCSIRYFCVFLSLVLLLPAFSIVVNAEDIEVKEYKITVNTKFWNAWNTYNYSLTVYPNNDVEETLVQEITNGIPSGTATATSQDTYIIENVDGSPLFKANKNTTFNVYNLYHSVLLHNANWPSSAVYRYDRDIQSYRALIHYSNSTTEYIDNITLESNVNIGLHNLTLNFTPKKDVTKVEFILTNEIQNLPASDKHTTVSIQTGEHHDPQWSITITQQSEEASLLSGVLGVLQNVKSGITDVFNSIKELPSKIWSFIENGLKNLFVPKQEFIVNYQSDMKALLKERLGAVYEVVDITLESWDNLKNFDDTNTIAIPRVEIPLLDNNKFSFGGYEVKIVPDGFDVLVNAIKLVVGMCCSVLFINGLRKRYDEIMGVE